MNEFVLIGIAVVLGGIKGVMDTITFHKTNCHLPEWMLRKAWRPNQNLIDYLLPSDYWHRLDLIQRVIICIALTYLYLPDLPISFVTLFLAWSISFEAVFMLLKKWN